MSGFRISEVRFTAATDPSGGLLGWISCVLNASLRLDGIALRMTREGRRTLAFPARRDRRGVDHPILRPVNDEARREIERQVLDALGMGEGVR